MMGKDQSAMEPLNPKPYSSPVITHHQTSYNQQSAYNQQPSFNQQPAAAAQPPPLVFGPTNTMATCPHCKASIKTAIEYSVTTRTHRTAVACCPFCCCCLPYCLNSARNVDHFCPNCKVYLGTYER